MRRVTIFTTNSVEKLHPRIEMQKTILENNGFSVNLVLSTERREGFVWEIINLMTLKYFKWRAINRFKKQMDDCDIAHIYDLQLLPLAKVAHKKRKKVIYETIDDNVPLNFFAISKKLGFLNLFKGAIIRSMENYEKNFSNKYCHQIIVNSPNLIAKFKEGKVTYIPYSSPLQDLSSESFSEEKETVFLYLGKLTEGKGARIYKDLIEQHKHKMLFFGKAYDAFSIDFSVNNPMVLPMGNLTSSQLKTALLSAIKEYNLVGLSIILPENESYKWQEANKDIDYIAMGIPFIGNDRPPTLEKIEKGVGALYTESKQVNKLLTNTENFYNNCVLSCHSLEKHYTLDAFEIELLKVYA